MQRSHVGGEPRLGPGAAQPLGHDLGGDADMADGSAGPPAEHLGHLVERDRLGSGERVDPAQAGTVVSAATAAAAMSRASIIATRPSRAAVATVPSRTIGNRFCMKNTGRSTVCWTPESCRMRSACQC